MAIRKRPELDIVNPPGCIRNDITLGDYVARKQEYMREEGKKLSFGEWYQQRLIDFDGEHPSAQIVWEAAQRNK